MFLQAVSAFLLHFQLFQRHIIATANSQILSTKHPEKSDVRTEPTKVATESGGRLYWKGPVEDLQAIGPAVAENQQISCQRVTADDALRHHR